MYCSRCGTANADDAVACRHCGEPILVPGVHYPASRSPVPQKTGLAVASLACGIGGFASCGLTAPVGLILGLVALAKARRRPEEFGGKGMAIAGLICSGVSALLALALVVGTAALMPVIRDAGTEMRKSMDDANLNTIGLSIEMYRSDYDSAYPPSLGALTAGPYLDPFQLVLVAGPFDWPKAGGQDPAACCRYAGPLPTDIPGDVIVCYTKPGLLTGGRNVLRADLTVRWVDDADLLARTGPFHTCLAASYRAVVDAFGDELTPERDAELREFYEVVE